MIPAVFLLAACASRPDPISLPDYEARLDAVPVDAMPSTSTPKKTVLVPYPGLGVNYVQHAEQETYHYDERYYCYVDGRWFQADSAAGPWGRLSMKYVPVALYRVRGHLPPKLEESARKSEPDVALVSFKSD